METKNRLLISPVTGVAAFGFLGTICSSGDFSQPGGKIVLKQGVHYGPNHGFGAEHIWREHKKEMRKLGYEKLLDIPKYVASIIIPRTPVHCDFSRLSGYQRISVVRSKTGKGETIHTIRS